jgi:AcrR family transcriptional regulator
MATRGRPAKSETSSEELKKQILSKARFQFAKFGYQGASLKDICKQAGVANSLINYHFKDKKGLFKALLESFAISRMEAINRLLSEARSREEICIRIELFVEEMLTSMIDDPDTFDIIEREMKSGNPMVLKLYRETLLLAFNNVVGFFKKAQDRGLLRKGTDPFTVAGLLFTVTCDSARKEFLGKKFFNVSFTDEKFRRNYGKHIVELFMNGVMK